MKRIDSWLVELGLTTSRTKAQRLIEGGEVRVLVNGNWKTVRQTSAKFEGLSATDVALNPEAPLLKYVSRGGLKLEGALSHLNLSVQDYRVLDVGISTGGFSDCLLAHGAREIVGIDVGHGQLAEKLAKDPRITQFEGVNVRTIAENEDLREALGKGFDLCVVDVSFISLQLVLPALAQVLSPGVQLLALVKPQFELGAAALDKSGVVRDPSLFNVAIDQVMKSLLNSGFISTQHFICDLKGQDGNQEFFIYSQRG